MKLLSYSQLSPIMHPKKISFGPYKLYALGENEQYTRYMRYSYKRDTQKLRNIANTISRHNSGENLVVADVGANIGITSFILSDIIKNSSIYSFEPNPVVYNVLSSNFEDNSKVFTYNAAVSHTSEGSLHFSGHSAYGHLDKIANSSSIEVRAISINDFAKKNGFRRVHFAKIDVEGFEVDVLMGAKDVLEIALFEFNPYCINTFYNDTPHNFLKKIMEEYRIFDIKNNDLRELELSNLDDFILDVYLKSRLKDLVAINKSLHDICTFPLEKLKVHVMKESITDKLMSKIFLLRRIYDKWIK